MEYNQFILGALEGKTHRPPLQNKVTRVTARTTHLRGCVLSVPGLLVSNHPAANHWSPTWENRGLRTYLGKGPPKGLKSHCLNQPLSLFLLRSHRTFLTSAMPVTCRGSQECYTNPSFLHPLTIRSSGALDTATANQERSQKTLQLPLPDLLSSGCHQSSQLLTSAVQPVLLKG